MERAAPVSPLAATVSDTEDSTEAASSQGLGKDIGWTPSFHSLSQMPQQELVAEASSDRLHRASAAPTVHEAVTEDEDAMAFADSVVQGVEAAAAAAVAGTGPWAAHHSVAEVPTWAATSSPSRRSKASSFSPAEVSAAVAKEEDLAAAAGVLKEISELRMLIAKEASERMHVEALQSRTSRKLEECEAQIQGLTCELEESRDDRNQLRQQLKEKSERNAEMTRRLSRQQEANRSLETDLGRAAAERQMLETKVSQGREALSSAETAAHLLRERLRHAEGAACGAMAGTSQVGLASQPASMEQDAASIDSEAPALQQLRAQFEATLQAVQRSARSSLNSLALATESPASSPLPQAASQHRGSELPEREGQSSSVEQLNCDAPDEAEEEDELPTAGGLLREWASVYQAAGDDLPPRLASPTVPPNVGAASSGGLNRNGVTETGVQDMAAKGKEAPRGHGAATGSSSRAVAGGTRSSPSPRPAGGSVTAAAAMESPVREETSARSSPGQQGLASPSSAESTRGSSLMISMRDLCEIKALKKPPPPIRMLMEVCCLLFHIQPVKQKDENSVQGRMRIDYWEPARRYLLSDPFLLSKLRSYDEEIAPAQKAKIRKYFKDPEFSSERVLKCSKAAFELYTCVSALMGPEESTPPRTAMHADS
eukprot:TRINITY_DN10696_c0_g1_i1.p1 TRINITY_DN10696_c0_g1~~TRINITY_DN10696_c0_g1_i1.p1  ORF type:complete len:714 (+),score=187.45 TRINITY_DN10696_c0_g1_i1:172-2142(+)